MKKILLVDDSRTVRMACRRILQGLNFETLEAENGQEALQAMQQNADVDLVLLDWNMPVMDGLSFLKSLRDAGSGRLPKVVMCTTENDMQRIVEALEAGASEYIMKPFTEEIIRDKLESVGIL